MSLLLVFYCVHTHSSREESHRAELAQAILLYPLLCCCEQTKPSQPAAAEAGSLGCVDCCRQQQSSRPPQQQLLYSGVPTTSSAVRDATALQQSYSNRKRAVVHRLTGPACCLRCRSRLLINTPLVHMSNQQPRVEVKQLATAGSAQSQPHLPQP